MTDLEARPGVARLQALVQKYDAECTPAFIEDLRNLFMEMSRGEDIIFHVSVYRTDPPRLEFSFPIGQGLYQTAFMPLKNVPAAIKNRNRMHCWWKFWEGE